LGQVALAAGQLDDACRRLRSACTLLDATVDVHAQAGARIALGRAALAAGDPNEALEAARAARARAAALADELITTRASVVEGRALLRLGDPQAAARLRVAVTGLAGTADADEASEAAADLAEDRGRHGT
jgi:hypothetical protein